MSDRREHRGPHPQDRQLFADEYHAPLCRATHDLSWLLTNGYASNSALKLVGDRYRLTARQRLAVARCSCGDQQQRCRWQHRVEQADVIDQELWIDGYNVLTSVEAALAEGIILHGRDGCYRDMASMHGQYRKVQETLPAIRLLGEVLSWFKFAHCRWYLDTPVSNSGRLKTMLLETAQQHDWPWSVELVADPDWILACTDHVVASADSQILDKCQRWFNLARAVIEIRIPHAYVVDLSGSEHGRAWSSPAASTNGRPDA